MVTMLLIKGHQKMNSFPSLSVSFSHAQAHTYTQTPEVKDAGSPEGHDRSGEGECRYGTPQLSSPCTICSIPRPAW